MTDDDRSSDSSVLWRASVVVHVDATGLHPFFAVCRHINKGKSPQSKPQRFSVAKNWGWHPFLLVIPTYVSYGPKTYSTMVSEGLCHNFSGGGRDCIHQLPPTTRPLISPALAPKNLSNSHPSEDISTSSRPSLQESSEPPNFQGGHSAIVSHRILKTILMISIYVIWCPFLPCRSWKRLAVDGTATIPSAVWVLFDNLSAPLPAISDIKKPAT